MHKSEFNMEIEDFVKFPESDVDPEAPQISLELTVRPELYLDAPFTIWSTLRYEPSEQEDEDHPVTIQWDLAKANRNLILLRQTANGFEKVEIKKDETPNGTKPQELKGNGHEHDDFKQDQVNGDQHKPDEVKTNGVKHEEVKQDEPMPDKPSHNESEQEKSAPEQKVQDETKPTEVREDQLMSDGPKLEKPASAHDNLDANEAPQEQATQDNLESTQDELMPDRPETKQPSPTQSQEAKQDEPALTQDQLMPDHNDLTPRAHPTEPSEISTPTPQAQPTLKISLSNPDLTSLTLSFPTPPTTTSTSTTASITTQTIPPYTPLETTSFLPTSYNSFLKPENTYVLVFPGCAVPLLCAEEERGRAGKEEGDKGTEVKEVVIPGTWTTEFEVRETEMGMGLGLGLGIQKLPGPEVGEEELFVPTRLGRANTVPSFRMSFHE